LETFEPMNYRMSLKSDQRIVVDSIQGTMIKSNESEMPSINDVNQDLTLFTPKWWVNFDNGTSKWVEASKILGWTGSNYPKEPLEECFRDGNQCGSRQLHNWLMKMEHMLIWISKSIKLLSNNHLDSEYFPYDKAIPATTDLKYFNYARTILEGNLRKEVHDEWRKSAKKHSENLNLKENWNLKQLLGELSIEAFEEKMKAGLENFQGTEIMRWKKIESTITSRKADK